MFTTELQFLVSAYFEDGKIYVGLSDRPGSEMLAVLNRAEAEALCKGLSIALAKQRGHDAVRSA